MHLVFLVLLLIEKCVNEQFVILPLALCHIAVVMHKIDHLY